MEEMERRWKDSQEECRERDDAIGDLERRQTEMTAKMKQSQTAFESLRAEKNAVAKELLQAQVRTLLAAGATRSVSHCAGGFSSLSCPCVTSAPVVFVCPPSLPSAPLQDDVSELKRKEKVQANQIEQLKEDMHSKDRALVGRFD